MRLKQNIGNNDLALQLRVLAFVSRIPMTADVIPRTAVETTVLHVGDVIGSEVVAEFVPLIDRAPDLATPGMNRDLRIPEAYTRSCLPPGVDSRTSARWNSASLLSVSSTLDCDPTETNICLPSAENAMSRVQ